ncbi:type II secretion system protein F [Carboxydocella sp. JDF658]|nr:type II secretion system protein F [Carboxydocella sp. JDF658]
MQRHPRVFPELYVTMLRAGEIGGVLDKVLERLADHYEKEYELREKIKTATRYPLVIMLFAIGVVILLLTTVVPTFVAMFNSFKAELPLATRILLGISSALTGYWYLWLLLLAGGGLLLSRFLATEEGKNWRDALVLRLPVFGELSKKVALARVCRTLGTLLATGVPILQAVEVVAEVAGNRVIGRALLSTRDNIREGEGIAAPLEQTGVFPPLVTQMVAVGEETGNLDGMLSKVADFYDREVKNTTESLASLLEPLLIGFLAIVVGAIIVSTILPIFDLYGHIGGQ